MSRDPTAPRTARDLKRSALAVAMVLLKELDEALPEENGAQAIAGVLLEHKRMPHVSAGMGVTDEHVNGVMLAITATIGRLLDAADDKCPEGPLKPMLLFKIVEELAEEGYDLDCIVDFVRRAHAGGSAPDEPSVAQTPTGTAPRSLRWAS